VSNEDHKTVRTPWNNLIKNIPETLKLPLLLGVKLDRCEENQGDTVTVRVMGEGKFNERAGAMIQERESES
jgi:hypothetical protein